MLSESTMENTMVKNAGTVETPRYRDEMVRYDGGLLGKARLVLHSRPAALLVRGRHRAQGKEAISGLFDFAKQTQLIWREASKSDPFAEWFLVKLDGSISQRAEFFREENQRVESLLNQSESLQGWASESSDPSVFELSFGNTYSFLGARLLGEYDRLVRLAQSARGMGLMDSDERYRMVSEGGPVIRSLFEVPNEYRSMEIYRPDPEFEEKIFEGEKYMGKLPDDIKSGTKRPEYDPLE